MRPGYLTVVYHEGNLWTTKGTEEKRGKYPLLKLQIEDCLSIHMTLHHIWAETVHSKHPDEPYDK